MKKNKKKGFMLIETLLVSTFVLGVLTYLFVQFSALKRNYDDSFKYNTVSGLYGAKNINQYITRYNGYNSLITNINSFGYMEFSCALIEGITCTELVKNIKIKHVYLVKDNIFKNNITTDLIIFSNNDELYQFSKKINFKDEESNYHLIVEYSDNTYAEIAIII